MGELLFRKKYRVPSARLEGWNYSQNGYYFVTICTKGGKHQFGEIKNGRMCLYRTGSIAWQYWLDIPKHFHHVYLDQFVVMPNHIHMVIHINHGSASRFETCGECKRWGENRGGGVSSSASIGIASDCGGELSTVRLATKSVETGSGRGGELPMVGLITKSVETLHCNVSTRTLVLSPTIALSQTPESSPTKTVDNEFMSSISPTPGSIPTIIRSYKSIVTKNTNKLFDEHNVKQKFAWQTRFYDRVIRSERELFNVREYIRNNPAKWWRDRNNTSGIFM